MTFTFLINRRSQLNSRQSIVLTVLPDTQVANFFCLLKQVFATINSTAAQNSNSRSPSAVLSHIHHELNHTHLHWHQRDLSDPLQQQSTPINASMLPDTLSI